MCFRCLHVLLRSSEKPDFLNFASAAATWVTESIVWLEALFIRIFAHMEFIGWPRVVSGEVGKCSLKPIICSQEKFRIFPLRPNFVSEFHNTTTWQTHVCTLFQRLDGHLPVLGGPVRLPHLSEVALSQFAEESELLSRPLPRLHVEELPLHRDHRVSPQPGARRPPNVLCCCSLGRLHGCRKDAALMWPWRKAGWSSDTLGLVTFTCQIKIFLHPSSQI